MPNVRRLLAITFFWFATGASAHDFVFCVEDQHFAPFLLNSTPIEGMGMGYMPDMVLLAAEQSGVNAKFIRLPWKRCQQQVKQGEVDALFAFIYSEERDNWAAFPKTDAEPDTRYLYLSQYQIFTGPNTKVTWDGNVLAPADASVQSVPGYIAEQKLIAMGFQPKISLQPNDALPLVAAGRLDGFVVDSVIGRRLAAQLHLTDRLSTLPMPFMEQRWYVAFSKQSYAANSAQIEAFWTALGELRKTQGDTILQQYSQR